MTTLTASRVAELPRINLLPPEIAQAARLRRLQVLLGVLLLGVLGLVALLFSWASGQASAASADLDAAQVEGAQLQSQVASYAEVPAVQAQVEATQTALVTAMTPEIRFSYLMNDMSLIIPKSSRLSTWTMTNTASDAQTTAPTTTLPDPTAVVVEPSMGTVTFEGKSNSLDAVAAWLQTIANQKAYFDATLASAVKDQDVATRGTVYTVTSGASLSLDAASNRYQQVQEGE